MPQIHFVSDFSFSFSAECSSFLSSFSSAGLAQFSCHSFLHPSQKHTEIMTNQNRSDTDGTYSRLVPASPLSSTVSVIWFMHNTGLWNSLLNWCNLAPRVCKYLAFVMECWMPNSQRNRAAMESMMINRTIPRESKMGALLVMHSNSVSWNQTGRAVGTCTLTHNPAFNSRPLVLP